MVTDTFFRPMDVWTNTNRHGHQQQYYIFKNLRIKFVTQVSNISQILKVSFFMTIDWLLIRIRRSEIKSKRDAVLTESK